MNSTTVAQGDRNRRADRGLDLRGVGGEPRDHLAGLGFVEKVGGERGQMREHVAAQIGDDALAERGDEEVARRAGEREQRRDADHDQKVAVDQRDAARGEAEIDHAPHRDRHDQRGQRRHDQRAERGKRAPAVAFDVGQERSERPQIGLALVRPHRAGAPRPPARLPSRVPTASPRSVASIVIGREVHAPQCLFAARRRLRPDNAACGRPGNVRMSRSVRLSRRARRGIEPPNSNEHRQTRRGTETP